MKQFRAVAHPQVPSRLAGALYLILNLQIQTGAHKVVEQLTAPAIQSYSRKRKLGIRNQGRSDQEERRSRQVSRDDQMLPCNLGSGSTSIQVFHPQSGAEFFQGYFAVIPGWNGLFHGGDALRIKAGKQNARFHLGAGDRERIPYPFQGSSPDPERRQLARAILWQRPSAGGGR